MPYLRRFYEIMQDRAEQQAMRSVAARRQREGGEPRTQVNLALQRQYLLETWGYHTSVHPKIGP